MTRGAGISIVLSDGPPFQATAKAGGQESSAPGATPYDAAFNALRPLLHFTEGQARKWASEYASQIEKGCVQS